MYQGIARLGIRRESQISTSLVMIAFSFKPGVRYIIELNQRIQYPTADKGHQIINQYWLFVPKLRKPFIIWGLLYAHERIESGASSD